MAKEVLSCLILDFYKAEKVLCNLEGLCSQKTSFGLEVCIGDNSVDTQNAQILSKGIKRLQTIYPDIQFSLDIFSTNTGYSVGNNRIAHHATGKRICVLNPDIQWKDNFVLQKLWEKLDTDTSIGIIAPAQKELPSYTDALSVRSFPSLFVQIARRTFLRFVPVVSSWVQKDEMSDIDRNKEQPVDWVQSSFFMIGQSLWEELGGFDERYFLFLADTQMCLECWRKGKKVWYFPHVEVYSDGIRCSEGGIFSFFTKRTLRIHVWDSILYFLKNKKKGLKKL